VNPARSRCSVRASRSSAAARTLSTFNMRGPRARRHQRRINFILESRFRYSRALARATNDQMSLSNEFLSMMLGVRRAGVTVALGTLKAAGLIRNTHGQVTVVDRSGLEAASCECYRTVRNEFARLLS
jgi:CRP-like cAMP-binding protein